MKTLISMGLAAGIAVSLATAANATPTLVGSTTDPTGINGLVVEGITYNVTFSLTTLNSFTEGSTLSNDSIAALQAALNTLSVTELNNFAPPADYMLDVDNSLSTFDGPDDFGAGWGGENQFSGASGVSLGNNPDGFQVPGGASESLYIEAADFTAVTTSVPEPLTLSLFGAGLLGAAALRRRKAKR